MHFRHTGETPHRCDICKKSFTRKEHYVNHYMWHTGKSESIHNALKFSAYIVLNFVLLLFDSERWNTSSMHCLRQKIHQKRAFGQSHAITYKWHAIPLRNLWQVLHKEGTLYQPHFMVIARVNRHLVSPKLMNLSNGSIFLSVAFIRHTGETPHRCDFCSKTFTRKEHLLNHVRQHTNESPHRCTYWWVQYSQIHTYSIQPNPCFNYYLISDWKQHEDVHTQGTSSQPYAPTHRRNSFQVWILPKGKFACQ